MSTSDDRTVNTDGLVLKYTKTGESDRLLFILTRDHGVVRAFAKSAERPKNKLHSSTNVFSYCRFTLYSSSTAFRVTECELIEQFYNLRLDLKTLSLAGYLSELACEAASENDDSEEILRLHLNTLHFLCTGERNIELMKAVYELRLASLCGFAPSLVACDKCGKFETEKMLFDTDTGKLYCSDCTTRANGLVDLEVITAMRQIEYAEMKFIFSTEVSERNIPVLSCLTEEYISNSFLRKFKTLDYYKSI